MTTSPYTPPDSDVYVEPEFKRALPWKIYFFLYLAMSLLGYGMIFLAPGAGFAEVISLVIGLFSFAGLFGYVFCKQILSPRPWLVVLVLSLTYSVAYYFITDIDLAAGMTQTANLISQAFGWAFSLPGFIALYLYSRPSDPIWQTASD